MFMFRYKNASCAQRICNRHRHGGSCKPSAEHQKS